MWTAAFWLLGPPALILLGFGLLWFQSWGRQYGSGTRWFYRSRVVTALIAVILAVGVAATSAVTMFFFAPPLWILAGAILIVAALRYWRSEVRFLVWTLSAAAERGIPLETAARAFARDHRGAVAVRASRLADYLDAAMPLSLALTRSGLALFFPEVRLAAAVGEKTGTLGKTLRKTVEQSTDMERVMGSILARLAYLACVVGVLVMMLAFYMIKIMPIFVQMFREFDLSLPRVTQVFIGLTSAATQYWYLVPPLATVVVAGVLVPLIYYLAPAFRALPIIGNFFSPVNEVSVTQMLAVAVAQRQPVVEGLELLASYSHALQGRSRLVQAMGDIAGGSHWCNALHRAGLVTSAHAAVFKSAERAGNLAWALDEMSERLLHRAALRARAVVHIGYPVLIGLIGAMVFFVAISLLLPLFSLISCLT
jgi:type II secretory pathway component PulF